MRFEKTVPLGLMIRLFALVMVLASLAAIAGAQNEPAPPPPPPGPGMMMHGPGVGFFHEEIGDDKIVTGAPMTVVLTTSRDQSLSDGNTIHNGHQATVYRDSQGRVRRDVQFELATTATGASTHNMVLIMDPVADKRYMLNPDRKIAHEVPMRPPKPPAGEGPGPAWKSGDNVTTEQLGTKTIMGLQATGTRVTRTIPAGQIGNAKAINVVTERWVSNDLQIPLETTHIDPMMGTVTTKATSVNRNEPDASLFQVPADYKVEAGHHGDVFYMNAKP
jgi:hypothetical protein